MSTPPAEPVSPPRRGDLRRLLSLPSFRWFWIAATITAVGDQFFTVTLPWLVLELSGSDAALGSVLMTAALPSAALTLVGGAISDRFPPARVLLIANVARTTLVAGIAALVMVGVGQLWPLYPIALAFGVLSALSGPAASAIVPRVSGDRGLATANSLVQTTTQGAGFVAPTPAGALIAGAGMGATFGVSAAAFALASAAYALLPGVFRQPPASAPAPDAPAPAPRATPAETMETLRVYLQHPGLQAYLVLIAALSVATSGPLAVGLPSLARIRFDGSVSLGLMMSASGLGAVIGTVVAGSRGRMRRRGLLLIVANALTGVLLALLAFAPDVITAAILIGAMNACSGFAHLIALAKLQEADRAILGRLMGVVMFASVGLTPVSHLLAGLASSVSPILMFGVAGGLVLLAAARAAFVPELRRLD